MIAIIFYLVTIITVVIFIYIIKKDKNIFQIQLTSKKENIILLLFCIVTSLSQILLLNFNYPLIGHDYSLAESHTISSFLYHKNNGFSIEWASPLFGGGILQYANPQYHQFSPLYFLTLIMPFWYSYNILTFIFSIMGFISIYLLLKYDFKFSFINSITGAVFLIVQDIIYII